MTWRFGAACLAAFFTAGHASAFVAPEVPGRDALPGVLDGTEGASIPAEASWEELKKVAAHTKPSQVRVDAVFLLAERAGSSEKKAQKQLASEVSDCIALITGWLDKEPDAAFRRHAVAKLFGAVSAKVRDRIPLHPKEAWSRDAWKRFDALRRRGLKDRDPRLAEFFERYEPLPGGPVWEPLKAKQKALFDAAAKDFPDKKEVLEKIWSLCESIEDSQRNVSDGFGKAVRKQKGVPAEELERLIRADRGTFEYRMVTLWGNMNPRNFVEQLGDAEASRRGNVVSPVKLGWPAY